MDSLIFIREKLTEGGWLPSDEDQDSLYLPQTPPLDVTYTNNYRALLTFGHPELGLVFVHDYQVFQHTLDRSPEELPRDQRLVGEIVGKTDRLLKTSSEIIDDEGELLIPVTFVLLDFPGVQQKSNAFVCYLIWTLGM
ncbi:hypothetical protein Thermus77420_18300 [Thermus thalpophilus]